MSKPVNTLIVDFLAKAVCFFANHAWLSTGHNQQRCNRCLRMEIKSPQTGYKWVKYVPETKEFNPID
jgi:hypothetical protein